MHVAIIARESYADALVLELEEIEIGSASLSED